MYPISMRVMLNMIVLVQCWQPRQRITKESLGLQRDDTRDLVTSRAAAIYRDMRYIAIFFYISRYAKYRDIFMVISRYKRTWDIRR